MKISLRFRCWQRNWSLILIAPRDRACQQILRLLTETGQPLAPAPLASRLQMSKEQVVAHLVGLPDTEFDNEGQIVGWGITLVPTQH